MRQLVGACCLCGRRCGVNRLEGRPGTCGAWSTENTHVRYASATLHLGEEPFLVGEGGSGAVFFSHCGLHCVFCQNHQISQNGLGREVSCDELADVFLALEAKGAATLNLVTPTSYAYPILAALEKACVQGLRLPVVYNTNGYDTVELLTLLDGIVDVYLPDIKYMDRAHAQRYSGAADYPDVVKQAIREMYRQVGPVEIRDGVAVKGLVIRHLVLPHNLSDSYDLLLWLRDEGLADAHLSLMSQYSPQHRARAYPELREPLSPAEYEAVVEFALDLGFENVLAQAPESQGAYLPDFENEDPFETQGKNT